MRITDQYQSLRFMQWMDDQTHKADDWECYCHTVHGSSEDGKIHGSRYRERLQTVKSRSEKDRYQLSAAQCDRNQGQGDIQEIDSCQASQYTPIVPVFVDLLRPGPFAVLLALRGQQRRKDHTVGIQ